MSSYLVTGLTGFVGSHLAREVPAVDLALDGVAVDLRDARAVCDSIDALRPQAVIHLAAQSSIPLSIEDPEDTFDVNFRGTLHLLKALRDHGFTGRMLYVGSGDVYGKVDSRDLPVRESACLRPRSPYAVSKVAAEALCYQWSQTGPFEIVVARPFNHVGPGQSTHFAVSSFARQIAERRAGRGAQRLVAGNLEPTRDFTDVRDVVRAYAALIESGRNGEAYNVCSGVERSMREVVQLMMEVAGVDMTIETEASLVRPAEQARMRGAFDKLAKDTGWQPAIEFRRTLADTIDYWQEAGNQ